MQLAVVFSNSCVILYILFTGHIQNSPRQPFILMNHYAGAWLHSKRLSSAWSSGGRIPLANYHIQVCKTRLLFILFWPIVMFSCFRFQKLFQNLLLTFAVADLTQPARSALCSLYALWLLCSLWLVLLSPLCLSTLCLLYSLCLLCRPSSLTPLSPLPPLSP